MPRANCGAAAGSWRTAAAELGDGRQVDGSQRSVSQRAGARTRIGGAGCRTASSVTDACRRRPRWLFMGGEVASHGAKEYADLAVPEPAPIIRPRADGALRAIYRHLEGVELPLDICLGDLDGHLDRTIEFH